MIKNFKVKEFLYSRKNETLKIKNEIEDFDVMENLLFTAKQMQRVRDLFGCPINITNGYRCPELNRAVGGSDTSQHMRGQACDFVVNDYGANEEGNRNICEKILASDIDFDQLIDEKRGDTYWVHISFRDDSLNRFEGFLQRDGKYTELKYDI